MEQASCREIEKVPSFFSSSTSGHEEKLKMQAVQHIFCLLQHKETADFFLSPFVGSEAKVESHK